MSVHRSSCECLKQPASIWDTQPHLLAWKKMPIMTNYLYLSHYSPAGKSIQGVWRDKSGEAWNTLAQPQASVSWGSCVVDTQNQHAQFDLCYTLVIFFTWNPRKAHLTCNPLCHTRDRPMLSLLSYWVEREFSDTITIIQVNVIGSWQVSTCGCTSACRFKHTTGPALG